MQITKEETEIRAKVSLLMEKKMKEREERRRLRDEYNLEGGNGEDTARIEEMHQVDETIPEENNDFEESTE